MPDDVEEQALLPPEEPAADNDNPGQSGAMETNDADQERTLDGRFQEMEERARHFQDQFLRARADLENSRRRARTDLEETRLFANEALVTALLEVLDNFERALAATDDEDGDRGLLEGVQIMDRQLREILERNGLSAIEALGQPFDPNVHEAVAMTEPEEGQQPGAVVEELRRGYTLHGRVIRPAMVRVTKE